MTTPAIQQKEHLPVVALVGRVNVGKSTLFNRLIEEHKAIVSDIPGTTRTRNIGIVLWQGREFRLVDTGGLTFAEGVPLEDDIIKQTEAAVEQADIVVLVTDAHIGIMPAERMLAKRLRRMTKKPIVLVVNKVDKNSQAAALTEREYRSLGLGAAFPISGSNGRNVGDFLDHLFALLKQNEQTPVAYAEPEGPHAMRVSLIGKPNVGKSSLFNKLIGEERVIVNEMPHTTREPHDTLVTYEGQPIVFVDTAGIRRKAAVSGSLEKMGISKSIQSLQMSDIILLVIDLSEPLASQDLQLGGMIERKAKSVIILLNKWDKAEDPSDEKRHETERMILSHFPHLDFAPMIFVSGKTGYRVHQIFPALMHAWQARQTALSQENMDSFIRSATKAHRPSRGKGTRHPEIRGMKQMDANPPVFELFVKYRTSIHSSYLKYIERRMRDQFDFYATPIVIKLTKLKR
jgi:GTP-binding protein